MRIRGSVTVFMALMTVCLFSAFFALLEAARVKGLKENAQYTSAQAADGLLSCYSDDLWEEYGLLFWECGESDLYTMSGAFDISDEIVEGNLEYSTLTGQNFYVLKLHLDDLDVESFRLATDDGCYSFKEQAVKAAKADAAQTVIDTVLDILLDIDEDDESKAEESEDMVSDVLDLITDAAESLKESESGDDESSEDITDTEDSSYSLVEASSEDTSGSGSSSSDFTLEDNPIAWMVSIKKNGIYSYLLPGEDISDKAIDSGNAISERTLNEGNWESENGEWTYTDSVLLLMYMTSHFDNVTDDGEDKALDYEAEYLIAGKSSDEANLKAVVRRILLLREAADLAYLETDSEKCQEAYAAALSICTLAGVPELADAAKQAILAAWAFAESMSDVRTLLSGGKVPAVKTRDTWKTDLNDLSASLTSSADEGESSGLSYENYLQIFMWMMSDTKLSLRAMDLMEENTGVSMDCMVSDFDMTYTLSASPLFWQFVYTGSASPSVYSFSYEMTASYLD